MWILLSLICYDNRELWGSICKACNGSAMKIRRDSTVGTGLRGFQGHWITVSTLFNTLFVDCIPKQLQKALAELQWLCDTMLKQKHTDISQTQTPTCTFCCWCERMTMFGRTYIREKRFLLHYCTQNSLKSITYKQSIEWPHIQDITPIIDALVDKKCSQKGNDELIFWKSHTIRCSVTVSYKHTNGKI